MCALISTWAFSRRGAEAGVGILQKGGNALDAVELTICKVELDESITSVGYGGLPNAEGILQLDAALMAGDGRVGGVLALERHRAAIPVARGILEHAPHPVLCGVGAEKFSRERGLSYFESNDSVLTDDARAQYALFQAGMHPACKSRGGAHTDTVGVIALDKAGDIAAGCATSGAAFKYPGRIGDVPLIGCGIYACNKAGAAVATGDGDEMLKYCLAFRVVELLRDGEAVVEQACIKALERISENDSQCQAAIAAMNAAGDMGAACTHAGFAVATWEEKTEGGCMPIVKEVVGPSGMTWKHTCE